MVSDEVLGSICNHFLNQNFNENDENICEKCFEMKDYLGVHIIELKSAQLIIKILQDEIKSTSTSSVSQHNQLNCVECLSDKEIYSSRGKDSAWKEIRQNKHFKSQSKKPLSNLSQQNSYIQLSKNRFEPLSNCKSQDPPPNHVYTKSKQKQLSGNSVQNKHKIVLIGDSQVRGCSDKLSNILGS